MNNEFKFKVKVIKNRFNSEEFKIYVVDVNAEIYKDIKPNKNKEFILVGNTPNLIPNIEYDVVATEELNKNFGYQYKVKTIRRDKPTDYNTSKNFLEEIITEKQANVLLDAYPNIIDRIIKNNLDDIDLNKTKGIKEKTFNIIKEKVIDNFCLIELVDTFGGLIDVGVMRKLYKEYSNISIIKKQLKQDPYRCLCKLSRVGFKTADSILLNLEEQNKINPNKFKFKFDYDLKVSEQRMKSCLNYILEKNEETGNTIMSLKDARKECGKLVPQCINLFVKVIKENSEDIYVDLNNKTISTRKAHDTENNIKTTLDIMSKENKCYNSWICNYELYRDFDGMYMSDEQISTIPTICNNNIALLTAPAGSGKSASVQALLNMLDDLGKTYTLMTPTGASSKVLQEYTKRDCGTIHRQLKYNPSSDPKWEFNLNNKLNTDIVIIDEFGMVGIYLLNHILEAINITKTKLLFVFDPYQLASVECGNIAQDLLLNKNIPVIYLSKIFRYNEGGLMQIATSIRNSEQFLPSNFIGTKIFGTNKDFIFSNIEDYKIPKQVLGIYNKILNDGYNIEDVMILSSQNKGDYGTKSINKIIQSFMQSKNKTNFIIRGDTKFYNGDKVIQIINNYKAKTPLGEETSIFNGNTGVVVRVGFESIDVDFGDKIIQYDKQELNQIELGYCISIHKSQGSSSRQVIVVAPKSHTFMLNSNLLYVGVTRAKERVYLVGNIQTINSAIKKKENLTRNTYLKQEYTKQQIE